MSNRRLDPSAGIRAVDWPFARQLPARARLLPSIGRWLAERRARDELAALTPRLRRDAGLPLIVAAPDRLEGVGAQRLHR